MISNILVHTHAVIKNEKWKKKKTSQENYLELSFNEEWLMMLITAFLIQSVSKWETLLILTVVLLQTLYLYMFKHYHFKNSILQ